MENQHRTFLWVHIGLGFENGRGREEGYRFIKVLTFWFLSTKHTKHINSSMESVKETLLTYRAQKEESQYYSLNLEEKMQFTGCIVFLFSFFFSVFLKEGATSFCGSVSTAWINWQGKQYLFIKKQTKTNKKTTMCSVLAWETKHFFPCRNFLNTCCLD